MTIREIQSADNEQLGHLIQNVLIEMDAPKVGTAFVDPFLFNLFEVYEQPNSVYFVIENQKKIIGGAGIGPLDDCFEICELQKMYFLPEARGHGFGAKLMKICIDKAKEFGYKKCYLETMPNMVKAQKLYKKTGFYNIVKPLGNTGHNNCSVFMLLDL
jgi:putative acetyltransferase